MRVDRNAIAGLPDARLQPDLSRGLGAIAAQRHARLTPDGLPIVGKT